MGDGQVSRAAPAAWTGWRAVSSATVRSSNGRGGSTAARIAEWRRSGIRPPVTVWTPAQTARFLNAIRGHRLYAAYHLIALRGLRRGEAAGLRWCDLDLDAATAIISCQLQQYDGPSGRVWPPGRSVPLDSIPLPVRSPALPVLTKDSVAATVVRAPVWECPAMPNACAAAT